MILCALALSAASLLAHADTIVDIQSLPDTDTHDRSLGFGVYEFKPEEAGAYASFFYTGKRDPEYSSLDTWSFDDPLRDTYKNLAMINLGVTNGLGEMGLIYLGVGYAWVIGQARYYDPMHILAPDGIYYTDYADNDDYGFNFNAGIIFLIGNLSLNAGYHSFSGETAFGVGWRF